MKIIVMPRIFLMQGSALADTIRILKEFIVPRNEDLAINFSELREINKSDLMVLIAQIEKSVLTNRNKIYRVGRFSSVKILKDLLHKNTEVLHKYKEFPLPYLNDAEKQKLVDPLVIDSVVKDLKKIGIKEYYFPFNVILTELIGNAVEHGIENRKISWWLTHDVDRKAKCVKYTFVDMGSGIINSHKKAGLPFKYIFSGRKKIVIDAFLGKLGSSTKFVNRGRGLPQLRKMIEDEIISNFTVITNNVSLTIQNKKFSARSNPDFIGTYYSWTIDQNNYHKWKSIQ